MDRRTHPLQVVSKSPTKKLQGVDEHSHPDKNSGRRNLLSMGEEQVCKRSPKTAIFGQQVQARSLKKGNVRTHPLI